MQSIQQAVAYAAFSVREGHLLISRAAGRFLLDENVSYRVARHLKAARYEAVHVSEIGLTSADDTVILSRAKDDDWVLVTGDHHFVQMLLRAAYKPVVDLGSLCALAACSRL